MNILVTILNFILIESNKMHFQSLIHQYNRIVKPTFGNSLIRIGCFVLAIIHTIQGQSQDFEVAPVVIQFNATQLKPESASIMITNHDAQPKLYELSFSDEIHVNGRKQYVGPGTTENSCYQWISADQMAVRVGPEQTGKITFKMAPSGANQTGTKWITAFVKVSEDPVDKALNQDLNTGIRIVPRIAIKIIQDFNDNLGVDFSIDGDRIQVDKNNNMVSLPVRNDTKNKVHKFKYYYSAIQKATGVQIESKPLYRTLYPGQEKEFQFHLSNLEKGDYDIIYLIDPGEGNKIKALRKTITIQ